MRNSIAKDFREIRNGPDRQSAVLGNRYPNFETRLRRKHPFEMTFRHLPQHRKTTHQPFHPVWYRVG